MILLEIERTMIFVNHCHVFPPSMKSEGTLDVLVKTMRACSIDRAVAFAPFEERTPPSIGDPNEWLIRNLPSYPEIVGFACINPLSRNSVEKLEKAWSQGLLGVKLHPPIQRFRINDSKAYSFYSKAQELGVILDFHTGVHGWRLMEYRPLLLDDVAYAFPDLKIIIEHVGGRGLYDEALALLLNKRNVYAGISSCLNEETHKAWYIGTEGVEELADLIGEDRLIYGTDFPCICSCGDQYGPNRRHLNILRDLELEEEVYEVIIYKNAERVLKP